MAEQLELFPALVTPDAQAEQIHRLKDYQQQKVDALMGLYRKQVRTYEREMQQPDVFQVAQHEGPVLQPEGC